MSEESIKPLDTSDNKLAGKLKFIHLAKIGVKFAGSCLKQNIRAFNCRNVVNVFIF